jgi:hypothetical protein
MDGILFLTKFKLSPEKKTTNTKLWKSTLLFPDDATITNARYHFQAPIIKSLLSSATTAASPNH